MMNGSKIIRPSSDRLSALVDGMWAALRDQAQTPEEAAGVLSSLQCLILMNTPAVKTLADAEAYMASFTKHTLNAMQQGARGLK